MSASDAFWIGYGFPIAGVIAAVTVSITLWLSARAFDRRYGREGRTPAE